MSKNKPTAKGDINAPPAIELHEQVARLGEPQPDGTVLLTEEQVEEVGAINAEAMQSNHAMTTVIGKKKANHIYVSWGVQEAALMYDMVVRVWPPATISVYVVRLTGAPIQVCLRGEPRTGQEFFEAIMQQVHKRSEEAEYKISLKDKQNGLYRGTGRIVLPNTLDDPNAGASQGSLGGLNQARPAPLPSYVPAPFSYPSTPHMPPAAAQPAPAPAPAAPHADPVVPQLLAYVQELTQHVVNMSRSSQAPTAMPAPPAVVAPPPAAPPPMPPPPEGATFFMPGVGWVTRAKAPSQERPAPTAMDQMRASLATVGEMAQALDEAKKIVPGLGHVPRPPAVIEPEPDAIKSVKLGGFEIVQSTEDGSLRPVETLIANGGKILDFVSRETERYMKMQQQMAERNAQQHAAQHAPPPTPPAALPDGVPTP